MRALMFNMIVALVSSGICAIAPQKAGAQPPGDEVDKQGVVAKEQLPDKPKKVVVTCPKLTDIVVTQLYPASIRAHRYIEIRAAMDGHLESIPVQEGQAVKRGDVLFKFASGIYKARLDVELAEVQIAQLEFAGVKKLFDKKSASEDELKLSEAKLARARAKAKLAEAELNTTTIKAPFDGLLGWPAAVVRVNGYRAIVITAAPGSGKTPAEAAARCVKLAQEVLPRGYRVKDLTGPSQ